MNHDLFCQYVPVINAYLNGNVDTKAKKWEHVVEAFYTMNSDTRFNEYSDLASAFKYSTKPTYLCIPQHDVVQYIDSRKLKKEYLLKKQYKEHVDFTYSQLGMRMTFSTFRRLLFETTEHIDAFEFADKIYHMYRRYEIKMITRAKIHTHWSIIERVKDFSKAMQLHNQKRNVQLMNEQPKVFTIVKGTSKSVRSRLSSYVKKKNTEEENVYAAEPLVPIYESVLSNADDEIAMFVEYIRNTHTIPFRAAQVEEGDSKIKITNTKYNVKISKSMILVDPSQDSYTPEMIKTDIKEFRENIKQGILSNEFTSSQDSSNRTSIQRYEQTNGEHFDDLNTIILTPSYEDVTLVSYNQAYLDISNAPVALDSECGESVAETVMSAMTQYEPKVSKPKATKSRVSKAKVNKAKVDVTEVVEVDEAKVDVTKDRDVLDTVYDSESYESD